ncbi:hypothetical protein CsSME_00027920 [Camellia sinensis var. sinensis]
MPPTVLDICHLLGLSLIGDTFILDYLNPLASFTIPSLNSFFSDFVKTENKKEGSCLSLPLLPRLLLRRRR